MTPHLADQLRRACEGGAWHGPALFELLADVPPHLAAAVPVSGRHSIWELTLHVAAWFDAVRRRLGGDPALLADDENFPPVLDFAPAKWNDARGRLRTAYQELLAAVLALAPADLGRHAPGREHNLRFLIEGAIQHAAYHGGQIALLKHLQHGGERALLRHTLATVAYRGGKAVRGAPPQFAGFQAGPTSRSALQILAHIGDLYDWALTMAQGRTAWREATPLPWPQEVERFFAALQTFDDYLASDEALSAPVEKLFQGPVADSLNHIGQIALLRRLAGAPIRGESYAKADIAAGRVGPEQAAPRLEFE
jgi:uncharacterized damage-inducible protein DinB